MCERTSSATVMARRVVAERVNVRYDESWWHAVVVFREMLARLLGLAGAEYCCVADAALGKVVEEAGARSSAEEGTTLAVLGWGSSAAVVLSVGATDALDDLIVTTRRSYHLVRVLDPGSGGPLLVYLRVDRRRGNLAVARRGLMAARPVAPAAAVPTQRMDPRSHR